MGYKILPRRIGNSSHLVKDPPRAVTVQLSSYMVVDVELKGRRSSGSLELAIQVAATAARRWLLGWIMELNFVNSSEAVVALLITLISNAIVVLISFLL